jgi:putative ABC transport system substrate-binding protein
LRRREFIGFVGGAATWPLAVRAQQPQRMRRIGVLMSQPVNDEFAHDQGRGGLPGVNGLAKRLPLLCSAL